MSYKGTFFSANHRAFSKIYHILGYKVSPSTYREIEITSRILSLHKAQIDRVSHVDTWYFLPAKWKTKEYAPTL